MKKIVGAVLVLTLVASLLAPMNTMALNNKRTPGGVPAFFIGCCFGLRVGTEWNEGADLHWREWGTIIPIVGLFISIWNGVDCAGGLTAHEFAEQNGANWY
jgi:hypothetical protein